MQKAQTRIEGREPVERGEDDYAVIDESRIGRVYSQQLQAGLKWHWSLEVAPASPPNQGIADSLDEAKAALAKRYEKVKRRQALADKAPAHWRPNWLSKSLSRRLTEERFLELLDWWVEEGDPEEIAAYLALRLICDSRWTRIVDDASRSAHHQPRSLYDLGDHSMPDWPAPGVTRVLFGTLPPPRHVTARYLARSTPATKT